jgi:zinc transport system substrate-binding protein
MRVARFGWKAAITMLVLATVLMPGVATANSPSVVVTLPPIHSLVSAVMGATGTPHLMLRGGQSPHNAALRPSDLRRLRNASLIVWVGPTLESFLGKPMAASKKKSTIITILDLPSLKRLSRRSGKSWDKHDHDHEAPRGLPDTVVDPHVWLSPINAVTIARSVTDALISQDPDNAAVYRGNTKKLIARISTLESRLGKSLARVHRVPYLVFHDAYQYFERHFSLNALGAVSISPDRRSGARRIAEIRRRIARSGARCVFREPQFPPRTINTIVKGTKARIGILDPLGALVQPGPDQWFKLMSALGETLVECLEQRS